MHAAVVHSFDRPPRYDAFPAPEPGGEHEVLVRVIASGLHPRVRSTANGSHYTSGEELPLIPGIDGVGRTPSGELVYFVLPDTRLGAMAELTVVDRRRSVTLPDDSDPAAIAAGMNPAMSSWVALRKRIDFAPGKCVLVLGATGNAGRLAVQVAKRLGAGEVIAAGRDLDRLAALGADSALTLTDDGALAAAADVDVVIDYLWGAPAERVMTALVTHRADRGRALDWIQIGSVVGPTAAIPSAALRAANLRVLGSGQGSIPTADSVGELPALAAEITSGALTVNPTAIPLSDVEAAWSAPIAPGTRVVLEP